MTLLHERAVQRGLKLQIHAVDPFEDNGHWLPDPHPFRDIANELGGPFSAFMALMFQNAPATLEAVKVHRSPSVEARSLFKDGSCALVMIDDAHSYEGCIASIRAWRSAVKDGGVLAGDDYHPTGFPGVVQAVKEAFGEDGYHVVGTTSIAGPVRDWERPAIAMSPAVAPPASQFDGSVTGLQREYNLESLPNLDKPTVLDIGANEGNFARYALQRYPGAKVHCYEPHPHAFSKLASLHLDAQTVQAAVTHPARGTVRLYDGVSGTHEASLRDDVRWPHVSQKLDSWFDVETIDAATLPEADVVKVDTEGSEVEILRGLGDKLKSTKVLLVECHAVGGDLRGQIETIRQLGIDAGLTPIDMRGTIIRFVHPSLLGPKVTVLPGYALDAVWVVVESLGGSRWVGKAVGGGNPIQEAIESGQVTLSPAFELAPSKLFFPMPQPGNADMGLGELTLSGLWSSMGTHKRRISVRWASLEPLAELPADKQAEWVTKIADAMGLGAAAPLPQAVAP